MEIRYDYYDNNNPLEKQGENVPVSKKSARLDNLIVGFPGFPPPHWSAPGALLYLGDARDCLRRLPTRSVHCCVTSPPYWGLRSYLEEEHPDKHYEIGAEPSPDCGTHGQAQCGECFVCSMVSVFREVHRVLRDDGTLWLNLGDSYNGSGGKGGAGKQQSNRGDKPDNRSGWQDIKQGNLVGVPWRVALALQADGWVLRQDIIWYSPSKMPESIQNRCTKSHEHIFLLAKGPGYYYDAVAIEEETKTPGDTRHLRTDKRKEAKDGCPDNGSRMRTGNPTAETKNKRDVWVVPTTGYKGAHFAVYSPKLITPCILTGTSEFGCCADCGRPYERVVSKTGAAVEHGGTKGTPPGQGPQSDQRNGLPGSGSTLDTSVPGRETIGWRKACDCWTDEVKPCVVLDPFCGSGTTVATSIRYGRHGVSIDLSEVYLRENAIPRIEDAIRVAEGNSTDKAVLVPPPSDTPPPPQRMR